MDAMFLANKTICLSIYLSIYLSIFRKDDNKKGEIVKQLQSSLIATTGTCIYFRYETYYLKNTCACHVDDRLFSSI